MYQRKTILFLLSILGLFSGCQTSLIHKPSFQLGKKVDLSQWNVGMSKEEVISRFGSMTVPCEDLNNICYLRADVSKLKLIESEFVEFVFDEQRNLNHVMFSRYEKD